MHEQTVTVGTLILHRIWRAYLEFIASLILM